MSNEKSVISLRLCSIVDRLGISAREFATRLNRSPATIHPYLHGKVPPADFIIDLCKVFSVRPSWIILGEGEIFTTLDDDRESRLLEAWKKLSPIEQERYYCKIVLAAIEGSEEKQLRAQPEGGAGEDSQAV